MKKCFCFLLLVCFLPVFAFADDVNVIINGHNLYADLTGAAQLEGEPQITTSDKYPSRKVYSFTVNGVTVGFTTDNEKVKTFYCKASEENAGELLSQAACALYNMVGTDYLSFWYPRLLDQFLIARAGIVEGNEYPFIEDVLIFYMKKENGIYTFMLSLLG